VVFTNHRQYYIPSHRTWRQLWTQYLCDHWIQLGDNVDRPTLILSQMCVSLLYNLLKWLGCHCNIQLLIDYITKHSSNSKRIHLIVGDLNTPNINWQLHCNATDRSIPHVVLVPSMYCLLTYKIDTNYVKVSILYCEIYRQNVNVFLYECTDTTTSLTIAIFMIDIVFRSWAKKTVANNIL